MRRQELLHTIATQILELPSNHGLRVARVAVDGVDGAGKTTFADELAHVLQQFGRPTIRASVDAFHNPKAIRYRLGKTSPEGFFYDSYNYAALKQVLLDPLSPGGSGRFRSAFFDHRTDSPVASPPQQARPGSILVFDGIFLHRPELRDYWDFSIFLRVAFEVSYARMARRDQSSPDPYAVENRRYLEGQRLYLRECQPERYASRVVNNDDLESPYVEVYKPV